MGIGEPGTFGAANGVIHPTEDGVLLPNRTVNLEKESLGRLLESLLQDPPQEN